MLGCRNEDFTGQYVNSKREEAFFREALSKTSRLRNNKIIIEALKKQNERSHFVSKMKDQSGLPVWDKMLVFKKPITANRGEDGGTAKEYVIPLTKDKENLSSILYITRYPDGTFAFNNIDNADLKETVNDKQVDKSYREQLLSNFIVIDHLTFPTDAVYWNLPDDLFANIPESQTYAERRFRINIKDSETGGTTNNLENAYMYCYEVVLDDPTCGCHGTTPTTVCTVVIGSGGGDTGGTGDTGGGTTTGDPGGGGGGGGSPTGDPGSNTDCNSPNKAFYKIVPGCDDEGDGDNGYLDTPCNKINTRFADAKFTEKYNELDKPENFNLDREKAFIMRYPPKGVNIPPSYFQVDMPPCATGSEDAVMPSSNAGLAGLMHTHTNSTCNGGYPIKVPSPVDIKYLLNTLLSQANQYTGSYSNAYSVTITSGGSYMLMYTGTTFPGSLNDDTVKQLKKDYTDKFQELYTYKDNNVTQADIEKVFTKFMKEKINKPGLEVYRVTPTSAVKIEYDPASPNSVKETPCP